MELCPQFRMVDYRCWCHHRRPLLARSHCDCQLPYTEIVRIIRSQVGSRFLIASISLRLSSCSGIWDRVMSSALERRLRGADSLGKNTSQFSPTWFISGLVSGLVSSVRKMESELALFLDLPGTQIRVFLWKKGWTECSETFEGLGRTYSVKK